MDSTSSSEDCVASLSTSSSPLLHSSLSPSSLPGRYSSSVSKEDRDVMDNG